MLPRAQHGPSLLFQCGGRLRVGAPEVRRSGWHREVRPDIYLCQKPPSMNMATRALTKSRSILRRISALSVRAGALAPRP